MSALLDHLQFDPDTRRVFELYRPTSALNIYSAAGGVVLWSKSFNSTSAPFDALLKDKFIEQSNVNGDLYEADGCTIQWLLDNSHGVIFAVAYPRILTLTYVPALLQTIKTLFLSLFGEAIKCLAALLSGQISALECPPSIRKKLFNGSAWSWPGWEHTFLDVCRDMEASHASNGVSGARRGGQLRADQAPQEKVSPSLTEEEADADIIARNMAAFKARQKSKARKRPGGKGDGVGVDSDRGASASETDSSWGTPKPKSKKELRKWEHSALSNEELAELDFSPTNTPSKELNSQQIQANLVDKQALGKVDAKGVYQVADFSRPDDDDDDDLVANSASNSTGLFGKLTAALGYSTKALSEADLAPVLATIKDQLLTKNVASEVADAICTSVRGSLLGSKQATGFRSSALKKSVRKAMNDALTRILTPKTSSDILVEIQRKIAAGTAKKDKEPYAITFVGVNGVGKSTNLSKIAFWLLQNKLRVLIAACDTFRSGAVEQLKVHVNNLSKLSTDVQVELYQRGYGKDAAGIAKDALAYAKEQDYDVVLIDTAGRMQDNEPLMRALAKLIAVNRPDKILFVGEALVGNEAVDQLVKFNTSLRNFTAASPSGRRGIDGIVLTKFDTIDDKVGAAVSMTYVTGQPLLFVGTGQTYSDIRTLRVDSIVGALLA